MGKAEPGARPSGKGAKEQADGRPGIAEPKAAAAFHRFVNLAHWHADFHGFGNGPMDLAREALAQLSGAERRLVADAIADLVGGRFTFAEAHAVWTAARNDTMYIRWDDADAFRDFLLQIRDRIDPFAWPVVKPRFRTVDEPAAR